MRAALAWTSLACLAAALSACSRSAPSPAAIDVPSASAPVVNAPADPMPSDEASDPPKPEAASSADATPTPAALRAPLVALAPPVRLDPAMVNTQPSPTPIAPLSPAAVAGGKTSIPTGPIAPPLTETAFAPHDECAAQPGWKAFRDKLGSAVSSQNAAALAALADRNVKLDYGGGAGRPELLRRLRQPASGLWHDLATILPLGCSVEGGLAALPWYFWRIPNSVDPANTMLVTGEAVPLRAAPRPTARNVMALDWPMVVLTGKSFDPAARFTRVRTRAGGQDGYVETRRLRSLLARRIIAEQNADEWRITAIVAGD